MMPAHLEFLKIWLQKSNQNENKSTLQMTMPSIILEGIFNGVLHSFSLKEPDKNRTFCFCRRLIIFNIILIEQSFTSTLAC